MYAEAKKSSASGSSSSESGVPFFQRKMKIAAAHDPAEREADEAADRVVRGEQAGRQSSFGPTIHRKILETEEKEKIQRKEITQDQGGEASPEFAEGVRSTVGKGEALSPQTRTEMEAGFGADFSGVRIHTDSKSAALSEQAGARAFTYGNDIYFNRGQYDPNSSGGKQLLAHELAHTIQQGSSPQRQQTIHRKPVQVQRGLLSRAWGAVSGAISRGTEWVADKLQEGINWVKRQAATFVSNIPGYDALTVALGYDPVAGRSVPLNGTNFLRAAIGLMPGGRALESKLRETSSYQNAAAYIDQQLKLLNFNLSGITRELSSIWNSLSISDVRNPRGVLERVATVFTSRLTRLTTFILRVAGYLVNMVKTIVARKLAEYVKRNTRAYPLLQVALGHDPITGEEVTRTPQIILQAILNLSPNGPQIYSQLEKSGALARAIAYMAGVRLRALAIATLAKANALRAWALVKIESLLQPFATFAEISKLFLQPAIRALQLVKDVVLDFLRMVKEALLSWLSRVADKVPGFSLLTVIIGKNPFTGQKVPRTPKNLLKGFFELIPGGGSYFKKLQESGAIDRMLAWVVGAVARFRKIGSSIIQAFVKLWRGFKWSDLAKPLEAFQRVINIVRKPVDGIIAFVADVVKQLILVLLQIMNFPIQLIKQLISKVGQAIQLIRKNPINFLKNLLLALKQGFQLFFKNIFKHLLKGVSDWLFGQLKGAGIETPQDLSLPSIFKMVLQILGITAQKIWAKLVKKIGKERAARLEKFMDKATGVWKFVKDVMTRGPIAIWEHIKSGLQNLWQMVLSSVRNWVITRVIQKVTEKILMMLDPTGIMAVVNSFIAIFKAIQTFIEKLREILQLLVSLADSAIQIAMGNVKQAASFVERSFASGLSIMISFLANQVGLNKIGKKIAEMVGKVRQAVDQAIDKLIDKAWNLGKGLLDKLKAGVNAIKNWWTNRKKLKTKDGKSHTLHFKGQGKTAQLMVASTPTPIAEFVNHFKTEHGLSADDVKDVLKKAKALDTLVNTTPAAGKEDAHYAKIDSKMDEVATALAALPGGTSQTTSISYGGLTGSFGSAARATYLDYKHPKGSEANSSLFDSDGHYANINVRKKGGASYYVRGHLLNDNVGGPGTVWDNLTPLSQDANGLHKVNWENTVKTVVNGFPDRIVGTSKKPKKTGYAKNVSIKAMYGRSEPESLRILKADTDKEPDDWQSHWDIKQVTELLESEKHVPTKLICTAIISNDMKGTNEQSFSKTIPNDIQHGVLKHYNLDGKARKRLVVGDLITGATNRNDAIAKLKAGFSLRNESYYTTILDRLLDKKELSSYSSVFGMSKMDLYADNPTTKFVFGTYKGSNEAQLRAQTNAD